MPALPAAGKTVRCDLFQTYSANTRVRDRIYFSYTGAGPSVADLNTLAATISAAWNTNISPQQNAGAVLTSIQLTDLASATGAQSVVTVNRVGTLAGVAVPAATAMIIKFRIARRYRGGHPRFYLVGRVVADEATYSTWSSASGASVATAWAAFIAACIAGPPASLGTMAHANVSYFLGFTNKTFPSGRTRAVPNVRATPVVDAVVGYSVNLIMGSQRRRSQQSA
jgi:hypothetical protein